MEATTLNLSVENQPSSPPSPPSSAKILLLSFRDDAFAFVKMRNSKKEMSMFRPDFCCHLTDFRLRNKKGVCAMACCTNRWGGEETGTERERWGGEETGTERERGESSPLVSRQVIQLQRVDIYIHPVLTIGCVQYKV
jgi:hypothetical protein